MIDEMTKILNKYQGCGMTHDALQELKTLFLKTIEECKPKDEKCVCDKACEPGCDDIRCMCGANIINQAISTYYDNLKRKIGG